MGVELFLGPLKMSPWELGGHGVERGLVVVGFTLLSCPEASQCTCHCLPTTHPTTTTTITDISIDFSLSVVSTTAHKTLSYKLLELEHFLKIKIDLGYNCKKICESLGGQYIIYYVFFP